MTKWLLVWTPADKILMRWYNQKWTLFQLKRQRLCYKNMENASTLRPYKSASLPHLKKCFKGHRFQFISNPHCCKVTGTDSPRAVSHMCPHFSASSTRWLPCKHLFHHTDFNELIRRFALRFHSQIIFFKNFETFRILISRQFIRAVSDNRKLLVNHSRIFKQRSLRTDRPRELKWYHLQN
jgi:hypothetical protein